MAPDGFEDFLLSLRKRSKKLDPFREPILHGFHEHPGLTGAQGHDWLEERMNFRGTSENTVRNYDYVNELRERYPIPFI